MVSGYRWCFITRNMSALVARASTDHTGLPSPVTDLYASRKSTRRRYIMGNVRSRTPQVIALYRAFTACAEKLRVTERFMRRDFGHMDVTSTIDDLGAYKKPWT